MGRKRSAELTLDIVVRSRHLLVAQAVGAALRRRDLAARAEPWERGVPAPAVSGDVVLLIEELASRASLEEVRELVAQSTVPVVVQGARGSRTAWGGALAAGAAGVLPSTASLDTVEEALVHVRAGEPLMREAERQAMVGAWVAWQEEERELERRLATLSAREASVLGLLAEGHRVVDVAAELGVGESTVRSQVKSLRRKLGVDSQLAAVAVVRRVTGGPSDDPPPVPSQR